MGLFKKRSTDPSEIDTLKSEIASMGARLDAADAAKHEIGSQVEQLAQRIDTPPPEPPQAPEPEVKANDVDMLRARIQRLTDRLDEADATPAGESGHVDELRGRIDELTTRLDTPIATPPPPPPPSSTTDLGNADVDDLINRIDKLALRLDDVDARITSISTELANQISEMSGELDGLGVNDAPADEVVGDLRDAQTRLANEQARYQIAFRQDLADLAARLKRS